MGGLILSDAEAENPAPTDAFKDGLDRLRRSIPVTKTRSRSLDFRTWSKSTPARQRLDGAGWDVTIANKRLMYDIRKASEAGSLVLYSGFVLYDTKSWRGSLRAPLFTTPMTFSPASATAHAAGERALNTRLVDFLATLGVAVDTTGDTVLSGTHGIASLTGEDRLAVEAIPPMEPASYLDHRAHPALLGNPLLRLFVEGSASEPSALAVPSERRPQAVHAFTDCPVPLDMDQIAAMRIALSTRASLIDGPPGTGKSQVIVALAHHAQAAGLRMLVTSTERSAIDVARRRTAGIDAVQALTVDDVTAMPPPSVGVPDFDIVVIDEASRMPFTTATTILSRARSAVVIGDDRQMRPDAESMSLLDRAQALCLPSTTLRFHYRSLDRSLISPSNILAYDMKLKTVPTPSLDPDYGLRTIYADGMSHDGPLGTQNEEEVRFVLTLLKDQAAKKNKQSVGVITSNHAQRNLIKQQMTQVLSEAEIARLTPEPSEPLLVTSARDCQGEERDVVIISTVYDKEAMRLGAFEKQDGLSTMNVMLSRSRQQMTIVTSYRPTSESDDRRQTTAKSVMDAFFFCIDASTTTETRQALPRAFTSLARDLNMHIDHLGVVIGLRRATERGYRAGIIPLSETEPESHWEMIDQQLKAVGWKTFRVSELECRRAPSEIAKRIRDSL